MSVQLTLVMRMHLKRFAVRQRLAFLQRSTDMRYSSFEIVIEKEPEDEGYFAYSPTIPGCFSNGRSIEQAKRNIRDAIAQHLESLQAHD